MKEPYLNITNSILYNPTLTSDEKIILAEITSLDKLNNGCIASDNHFAKIINKTRQRTNGIIKKLETKGFISIKVKQGIGKITKPVDNFWDLIKTPVQIEDTSEAIQEQGGVVIQDNPCQDSLQVGDEIEDTSCRDLDTTITTTNTELLIQEELQYTGAENENLDETIGNQYQVACLRIKELMDIHPDNIASQFLLNFMDSLAGLEIKFGYDFITNGDLFKSYNELYQQYGFENFIEVRQDLTFVRDNMDKFLRQKNLI
ncbi:hypothetical protein EWU23_13305 [Cytophagaceae bacterium 50C-KIRBA]|uniref:Helix-turn-helix domain-containing protein n=1 Tax=Aquirufa beregesia TaxID=2516556 RepID=A0ABX0F1R5_9BACT|nr:hypothetical protein [Aquirufa beregesia]NGZ45456.1 hypothetical protein [Aquirufa beregesia]